MSPLSFLVVLVAGIALSGALPEKTYTTKFDNVNVQDIIKNDRLLNTYYKCLLGEGTCTPDGEELKKNIGDALETACKKCSAKQKEGTEVVLRYLIKEKPKEFEQLEKKYDPKGTFRARYETELKKRA